MAPENQRDMVAKRKNTRTRSSRASKSRIAVSAASAASILEAPRRVVLAAKRAGCPAFKPNGSVDCQSLKFWLRLHPEIVAKGTDHEKLDREKLKNLRLRNDRLEVEIAEQKRDYVPVEAHMRSLTDLDALMRPIFRSLSTHAPSLYGLETADLETRLREIEIETLQQMDDAAASLIARYQNEISD